MYKQILKRIATQRSKLKARRNVELPKGTVLKIENGPSYTLKESTYLKKKLIKMDIPSPVTPNNLVISQPISLTPQSYSVTIEGFHKVVQVIVGFQATLRVAGGIFLIGTVIIRNGPTVDFEALSVLISQTNVKDSLVVLSDTFEYQVHEYIKALKFSAAKIFLPNNVSPLDLNLGERTIDPLHPVLNGVHLELLEWYLPEELPESIDEPNERDIMVPFVDSGDNSGNNSDESSNEPESWLKLLHSFVLGTLCFSLIGMKMALMTVIISLLTFPSPIIMP